MADTRGRKASGVGRLARPAQAPASAAGVPVGPGRDDDDFAAHDNLDAVQADLARRRYEVEGAAELPVPESLQPLLGEGERLLAMHRAVEIDGRNLCAGGSGVGELYLTSRRLLRPEPDHVDIRLDDIAEASLGDGLLLVILRCGRFVSIKTDQPRLLRVQMAYARAQRLAAQPANQT